MSAAELATYVMVLPVVILACSLASAIRGNRELLRLLERMIRLAEQQQDVITGHMNPMRVIECQPDRDGAEPPP